MSSVARRAYLAGKREHGREQRRLIYAHAATLGLSGKQTGAPLRIEDSPPAAYPIYHLLAHPA
eukprot:6171999-Pleurochrysis_carterae.AAC.2